MAGMLQIITYLLCIYLVYKGVEIFQIALMSSRDNRIPGLLIGVGAILSSVAIGIFFVYLIDSQALSLSNITH